MKIAKVSLGSRSYRIFVGAGLIRSLLDYLPRIPDVEQVALVTDSHVDPLYGGLLAKQLENLGRVHRLVVPAGENSKSWKAAGELLEGLAALRLHRHDLMVTLGGGMVSDLGGFAASTYLRGIPVIHVPSTLLGQVDAAIGGKTGVNLSAGKNLAGTFYQPSAVVCDVETLLSLPEREFRSGLAEVIKYGFCFEPEILNLVGEGGDIRSAITRLSDSSVLEEVVHRCASIKAQVVSRDESDRSGRLVLNYGHTFGHALEAAGGFAKWSHGEAIAVGMVFAAALSQRMNLLDENAEGVHRRVLEAAGLPTKADFDPQQVSSLWEMDKKRGSRQRWVLLEALGRPVIRSDVGPAHVASAMDAVRS